jgi:fucose permease
MLLGRFAASRILIRVPPAKLITLCGTLIAVTTFAMLRVSSQAAVTFAVLGAGLAMAPVFPTALSLVGDHFQQSNATAMGIAITSGWLGLAVSSPIVGIMAERSTLQHALLILPALAAAIVLVSMVLNIRLLKTQRT